MKKFLLETVVFVCGACLMVLEIAASRVLAPYLGTSIYVWTSLIGVILACLSLGYWLGGKMADRHASRRTLSAIILVSAIFIALAAVGKEYLLLFTRELADDPRLQSSLAALMLFGVPSTMLGIVSPYAVRLKVKSLETSGSVVGNLYAISSIGSIAGTFLAGFYLIAVLGTTRILLADAIALTLAALLLYVRDAGAKIIFLLFLPVMCGFVHHIDLMPHRDNLSNFIDADTQYSRIWIFDTMSGESNRLQRVMQINNESSSCMFVDTGEPDEGYRKFFRLVHHFKPGLKKALMIGGAALVVPIDFLKRAPTATIDVVEIDPGVSALAKKYFYPADNPRLRILYKDGRVFLNRNRDLYDAVLVDVFNSSAIPFHLITLQAVEKIFASLNEDGVVLVNIISFLGGPDARLLQAAAATYASVFPQVYFFPVLDPEDVRLGQNILLVALKSSKKPVFESDDAELSGYLRNLSKRDPAAAGVPVLTDDYAPVEYYQAHKHNYLIDAVSKRMLFYF